MSRKYIALWAFFFAFLTCFGQEVATDADSCLSGADLSESEVVIGSRQALVEEFCNLRSIQNANVSILFRDLESGQTVASHRPTALVSTASTMKILTTSTALELLGPDFRFSTFLEIDGEITNGVLNGNLYIRGTGDPTLGSAVVGNPNFIPQWVGAIKKVGIKQISGRVVADVSFYDPAEAIPYGWTHEDIGNYYSGGVYPLCYKDNVMTFFLSSGVIGSKAEVLSTDPYIPNLELENYFECCSGRDWMVHGEPYSNHRVLSGCIVPNKGRWSVKGAIPNPPLLLAQNLTSALFGSGVKIDSAATYTKFPSDGKRKVIYTHRSEPLAKILVETNQQSNNMYAEQIFRYLGSAIHEPVLISDCVEMERRVWHPRAVDISTSFVYDGSGLSPQDVVSARTLVDILTYMGKYSSNREAWMASLPVSGKSGTLKGFLAGTPLEGRVVAKSGTTSRVKAYAGYVNAADGHTYVFALMVNNANVKSRVVQREIANLLQKMF